MEQELKYSNTGKVIEITEEKDCISIGVDYDDMGTQYGSFPLDPRLKLLFPVGTKVIVLFDSPDPWRGRRIKGLVVEKSPFFNGQKYIIPPQWAKEYSEKQQKKWEKARKKEHERMMAIPRHRYESKYQFPDDVDIYGNTEKNGEGFRNSAHLSVSRGMEFLEGKDLKDFDMKLYKNIHGVSEDNDNIRKLKDHINNSVKKELGSEWGHSGMSMILVTEHVLKAKELGWDNYILYLKETLK